MKKVSIVFNLYQPKKDLIIKILSSLDSQVYSDSIELIIINKKIDQVCLDLIESFRKKFKNIEVKIKKVNENLSFASSMNEGLKLVDSEIVIVLQQDCIPENNLWLNNLTAPFEDKNVVATISKVRFPNVLWKRLNFFAKTIMLREQGTITPLLDEKACAYRIKALKKIGFFNEKDFHTAGEDFDMYIKLKKLGKLEYPNATIIHYHPTDFRSRLAKIEQYANGFGTLVKIHRTRMPHWYVGFLKATPLIGIVAFLLSYPLKKGFNFYLSYLILMPLMHFLYFKGFWKGYLAGKQSIDVFKKK